jgi:hypothetical protein
LASCQRCGLGVRHQQHDPDYCCDRDHRRFDAPICCYTSARRVDTLVKDFVLVVVNVGTVKFSLPSERLLADGEAPRGRGWREKLQCLE